MSGAKLLRKTLGIVVVLAMLLPMFVTPASAISGVAVINPIESNIAAKFWVAASADSGDLTAAMAKDDSLDTAWVADDRAAGHWLMLDLTGEYDNLRKAEVVFADRNAAYQYKIEASTDGSSWDVVADRTANTVVAEGFVDLFTRPGTRYLRLTITGATPGATMGVREIRVFNYLRADNMNGADISYADQYWSRNYYVNPNPDLVDMGAGPKVFDVVKDRGMEVVRLRIWNEPRSEYSGNPVSTPYCGPERSAAMAREIVNRGLKLAIDFHYADSWADPGKQPKPKAWAALPFDELVTTMHDWTYDYIKLLVDQGTTPHVVAIGNEILRGILWGSESVDLTVNGPPYVLNNKELYWSQPGGGIIWKYWGSTDPVEQQKYEESWDRFATLIAAGIQAVREASPETEVELHAIFNPPWETRLAEHMEFWSQLLPRINAMGADPDVLAVSYYSAWHGNFEDLEHTLYAIASTYPQYHINISEHAYPATGSQPWGDSDQPPTVQGQANMYQRTIQAINDVPNNKGIGVWLWEPQSYQPLFTRVPGMSNYYEPYASIDVFNKSHATHVLESKVYMTTVEGTAPALPAMVKMLTMSDGSIDSVPVTWSAIDPALYENHGSFTVTGTTDYGDVTAQVTVIYDFSGFMRPVDNLPAVNDAKAGSAIPLKFSLNGDHGLEVFAAGYPASQALVCDTGVPTGAVEEAGAAGTSSLLYDVDVDQYVYVWKTDKAWAGTCRQLILRFDDGTEYRADFALR